MFCIVTKNSDSEFSTVLEQWGCLATAGTHQVAEGCLEGFREITSQKFIVQVLHQFTDTPWSGDPNYSSDIIKKAKEVGWSVALDYFDIILVYRHGLFFTCQAPCACETDANFYPGIPGVLANLIDGNLPDDHDVQRCDMCQLYESDDAAKVALLVHLDG